MKITFFDTETNGLPKNWKLPMQQVDNWPRLTELSWLVTDKKGEILRQQSHLIKPDGWKIPDEPFFSENGFTTANSERLGLPVACVLDAIVADMNESSILVAHNMAFDHPVTGAEMIRAKRRVTASLEKICTMQISTDICKIPGPYGNKWPKLEELHHFLFNKGFEGAHHSLNDVIATKDCFFELVRRGEIEL